MNVMIFKFNELDRFIREKERNFPNIVGLMNIF